MGKAKTGFRFWKSHNCVHCKSAGVEVKDGADRRVCSAGNVQVATGDRGALIDLMMGDLETFLKSLNDWSGISDVVKWR